MGEMHNKAEQYAKDVPHETKRSHQEEWPPPAALHSYVPRCPAPQELYAEMRREVLKGRDDNEDALNIDGDLNLNWLSLVGRNG
jgi:hypothetical protein